MGTEHIKKTVHKVMIMLGKCVSKTLNRGISEWKIFLPRFEVITALLMKIQVFCDKAPNQLVNNYRLSG